MRNLLYLILLHAIILVIFGCENEGPEGKKSLVDLIVEPNGTNCSSGGYKFISGIDFNNNDILDSSEIQSTEYICNGTDGADGINGTDGLSFLINVIPESYGDNCANGGHLIISGIDLNSNDFIDSNEIRSTEYICHGADGTDGLNSLINVIPESEGDNCTYGGHMIISGIDLNNDGSLDENEIQNTDFICNEELPRSTLEFYLLDDYQTYDHKKILENTAVIADSALTHIAAETNKNSEKAVHNSLFINNFQTLRFYITHYQHVEKP